MKKDYTLIYHACTYGTKKFPIWTMPFPIFPSPLFAATALLINVVPTEQMAEGTQGWNRSSSCLCLALIYWTQALLLARMVVWMRTEKGELNTAAWSKQVYMKLIMYSYLSYVAAWSPCVLMLHSKMKRRSTAFLTCCTPSWSLLFYLCLLMRPLASDLPVVKDIN